MGDAVDLLNRNCPITIIVQTVNQRRESWSNSNIIIFIPDLKKNNIYIHIYIYKSENPDVLDRCKIPGILQIKQNCVCFSQDAKDKGVTKSTRMRENNNSD